MTIETVENLVGLLNEYPVAEITLEQDGMRVHVKRGAYTLSPETTPAAPAAGSPGPSSFSPALEILTTLDEEAFILTAPMVGVFHHLPSPLRYGVSVSKGQVIGHIESMKLMNDVPAEQAGQIAEVIVEDGGAVEYGQPLFRLAP